MNLRPSYLAGLLLLISLVLAALGVCVGSTGLENLLGPLLAPLQDPEQTAMARQIVGEIRLPRTLGAPSGREAAMTWAMAARTA